MKTSSLTLPKGTPAFLVDPLKAFMDPKGTFVQKYGMEDTEPVRQLLATMNNLITAWRGKAQLILCQSVYDRDQFGEPGLEELCTRTNVFDREPATKGILEKHFGAVVEKNKNSLWEGGDEHARDILHTSGTVILTGVTGTSCIRKTLEANTRELIRLRLVVPVNAIASRRNQKDYAEQLIAEWSDAARTNVSVVDRWQDIQFT